MNQETAERRPQAGDIWWISKAGGAKDMHFIVQTFEKTAITLRLIDREPSENGVCIGGMWVDTKLLSYTYYTRFDAYETGQEMAALGTVKAAIYQAIDCGREIPEPERECVRLKNELEKLKADRKVIDQNSDVIIDSLREEIKALKTAGARIMEQSKQIRGRENVKKAAELVVIAERATKEAEIYKELYKELLDKVFPNRAEPTTGEEPES